MYIPHLTSRALTVRVLQYALYSPTMTYPHTDKKTLARWEKIGSAITQAQEDEEFMKTPEKDRDSLFPLRYPKLWAYRKKLEKVHWVSEEVSLSKDREDLKRITKEELALLEYVLAFFSIADELILAGIDEVVEGFVQVKEGKYYLRAQSDQECVHSESYSLQIQEIIPDSKRRGEIFNAVKNFPAVGRMVDWVRFWCTKRHRMADVFTAMAFIEGAMFQSFFAAIQFFKTKNLFPGVTTLNELISRDEGVHASFWCSIVRKFLKHKPGTNTVKAIARETALLGEQFFAEAMKLPLVGLNAKMLAEYAQHTADHITGALGYEPTFGVKNPLNYMEAHALNKVSKTNFFEHDVTQYQSLGKESLVFRLNTSPIRF